MFALMSLISLSFAKEVPIASIEASSYRAPDSSTKYDPSNCLMESRSLPGLKMMKVLVWGLGLRCLWLSRPLYLL